MRWDCNKRHRRLVKWHRWFAWYPIRIGEECRWLETVWRRKIGSRDYYGSDYAWEYSANQSDYFI